MSNSNWQAGLLTAFQHMITFLQIICSSILKKLILGLEFILKSLYLEKGTSLWDFTTTLANQHFPNCLLHTSTSKWKR